mmetsp:Transcript_8979/g.10567  ORF Transcript_8979/g.10567 Transcript_8979/m.10567 type:complete len:88 (+) Transcript_8979:19-282(+)
MLMASSEGQRADKARNSSAGRLTQHIPLQQPMSHCVSIRKLEQSEGKKSTSTNEQRLQHRVRGMMSRGIDSRIESGSYQLNNCQTVG